MTNFEDIERGFVRAGLPVMQSKRSIGFGPGAARTFFCEIARPKGKPCFSIWLGSENNSVRVLDADKDLRQIVLMVQEQGGTFKRKEYDSTQKKMVEREVKVSPALRKFLIGFDERDAFMAQLPSSTPVTTVRQAHEALRNPALPSPRKTKVIRQGEWFFVPATKEEQELIEKDKLFIKKKCRIGEDRRGKPHTADEYLAKGQQIRRVLEKVSWSPRPRIREERVGPSMMFARGAVRHADHAVIHLGGWHRVLRNAEDRGPSSRWID